MPIQAPSLIWPQPPTEGKFTSSATACSCGTGLQEPRWIKLVSIYRISIKMRSVTIPRLLGKLLEALAPSPIPARLLLRELEPNEHVLPCKLLIPLKPSTIMAMGCSLGAQEGPARSTTP